MINENKVDNLDQEIIKHQQTIEQLEYDYQKVNNQLTKVITALHSNNQKLNYLNESLGQRGCNQASVRMHQNQNIHTQISNNLDNITYKVKKEYQSSKSHRYEQISSLNQQRREKTWD